MVGATVRVMEARSRGVIRLDWRVLTSPRLLSLTDREYRALTELWCYVAKFGDGTGEFPCFWLRGFRFQGRRRITPKMLESYLALGLLEEGADDDGHDYVRIVDWRSYRPTDSTSAERKRRWRQRQYGDAYYGTLGEVQEIVPASGSSGEAA